MAIFGYQMISYKATATSIKELFRTPEKVNSESFMGNISHVFLFSELLSCFLLLSCCLDS